MPKRRAWCGSGATARTAIPGADLRPDQVITVTVTNYKYKDYLAMVISLLYNIICLYHIYHLVKVEIRNPVLSI